MKITFNKEFVFTVLIFIHNLYFMLNILLKLRSNFTFVFPHAHKTQTKTYYLKEIMIMINISLDLQLLSKWYTRT